MQVTLTHLDGEVAELLKNSYSIPEVICAEGARRPRFYAEGALLPNFESATTLTEDVVPAKQKYSWGSDEIAVFSLDPSSQTAWKDFWEGTKKMEPSQIHRHTIGEDLLRKTFARVHERLKLGNGTRAFGFTVNHPKMATTTVDVVRGELCGIHLDSWESRSMQERLTARKRISINLGPGPRWFLFVPRTLKALADGLSKPSNDDRDPMTAVLNRIRQRPEDLTCAALCLLPGQAYIAPTESLMHDATSFWAESVNFSAQFLVQPSLT